MTRGYDKHRIAAAAAQPDNRSMQGNRVAIVAAAAVFGASLLAASASAASDPAKTYVSGWARSYIGFAASLGKAYLPCANGPTRACADAQQAASEAAARAAALMRTSKPPATLTRDAATLRADLVKASRTLAASATAARHGNSSARVWCSGEQGPCRVPINDMGNTITDINFTAGVDLPLPTDG
jgi:hypothetical protein